MGTFSDRIELKNALCATACCSLLFSSALGQFPSTSEVVHLDVKGLPAAPIRCLVKDNDGALWIGTENGLCRYDGVNVDTYRNIPGDSLSLPGNYILDLVCDSAGKIWVACFGGVSAFDPHRMKFERKVLFANGKRFPTYESMDLFQDVDGQLWLACVANGVAKYDAATGSFREVVAVRSALPPGESYPNILGVLRDAEGIVWIPDRLGLFRYDPKDGSVQRSAFDATGHDRRERILLSHVRQDVNDPNILWIGSWGLGLVHFDKRTGVFTNMSTTKGGPVELTNILWSIEPEENGRLLVGYENELRWFDIRTGTFSSTLRLHQWKTGSFDSNAYALLKDDDGRIWIGSIDGLFTLPPRSADLRVLQLRGQNWCPATDRQGYWAVREYAQRALFEIGPDGDLLDSLPLPNADVERYEPNSILQLSDGHVWIGTTQGLVIYDPSSRSFEREPLSSIPEFLGRSPNVGSIIEQPDGSIWLACHYDGVICFRPADRSFRFHGFDRGVRDTTARHECEALTNLDKDHIAMIFGWEGVGVLDTRTMHLAELNTGDSAGADLRQVSALVVHANGILYAVTISSGVVVLKYDGNSIRRLATYRDEQDPGNTYNDASGDASGNTWIATNSGLVKFDATDGSFQHFGPIDGFPLSGIATIQADNGGRIIAWGSEFVRFDPRSLGHISDLGGPYIRSVAVNGIASTFQGTDTIQAPLRLSHEKNSITIAYAPIALLHADALHYEVMLDGHDDYWVRNGFQRTVSYVGLPPGRYTFRVRIAGKQNIAMRSLFAFTIVPAWWQTWWFKIIVTLLTGVIVFFSFRYVLGLRYQKRIAALEHEREVGAVRTRIARDIHDDIGSGLTKITMLSRQLGSDPNDAGANEHLTGRIASASTDLIKQLSEIIWTVDPGNDRASRFVAFVRNMLGKQFEDLPVEVKMDLSIRPGDEELLISPDVKRNVVLILKESVNNALKHSGAHVLTVILKINTESLVLEVTDDGHGFDPVAKADTGNGLQNLRKRAESIGGELLFSSLEEGGTRVSLKVPLAPSTNM